MKTIKALWPALTSKNYTKLYLTGTSTDVYVVETPDIIPLVEYLVHNPTTMNMWESLATNCHDSKYVYLCMVSWVPTTIDTISQKYRFIWIQGQSAGSLASQQALIPMT